VSTIFYTSDTHFGHLLVARLRGFGEDVNAHDRELVARWNAAVGPDDHVWHLGDVTLGPLDKVDHVVEQLHGTIHLVLGNHDRPWPGHRNAQKHQRQWLTRFASLQPFARRKIAGRQTLMCHFPYRGDHTADQRYTQYRLPDEGLPLLHGHVHEAWRRRGSQINVGVDVWDLTPVPEHALHDLLDPDGEDQ
jgi:calcineurin-like phosphoesterase family protein